MDVWTWTHLRKFASGDPKSGGDSESLESGGSLERDLGRFESVTKHMKSNKDRCWVLLMDGNP